MLEFSQDGPAPVNRTQLTHRSHGPATGPNGEGKGPRPLMLDNCSRRA